MFTSKRISFSLQTQSSVNVAAALLILVAPLLLSELFLSSIEKQSKVYYQPLKTEIVAGVQRISALQQAPKSPSVATAQPADTAKEAQKKKEAEDAKQTSLERCEQEFGGVLSATEGAAPVISNVNTATAAGQHVGKMCQLLWQMSRSNKLAYSEMIMIAMCSLGALLFIGILYSRLIPIFFFAVVAFAVARGYLANWYVHAELLPRESAPNLFTQTVLSEAVNTNLIEREVMENFAASTYFVGVFAWVTAALVICTLAVLTLRGNGKEWYDPAELRRRRNTILMVGALIAFLYSMAIFRVETVLFWPFSLLELDQGPHSIALLSNVGHSFVQSVGTLFSLEIVVMLSLAILVLNQDINKAANMKKSDRQDPEEWRSENQLTLNYSKVVTPFISALPLASSYISDFLPQLGILLKP